MAEWIIEATIPIRITIEAEGELNATFKAIKKISKDYNIEHDRICIEGKRKVGE